MMHSYTEYNSSGDGLHIFFRADGFSNPSDQYDIINYLTNMEPAFLACKLPKR